VRRSAGLLEELSDEEVAAAPQGAVIARLTPAGWDRLCELDLALESLQLLDALGWEAVAELWSGNGIEYLEETP
jgi:hypothetical protein